MFDFEKQPKTKILIADISDVNRNILREILSDKYEIDEAENTEKAIELVNKGENYELFLLDIALLQSEGFSILTFMNETNKIDVLPVVLTSWGASTNFIKQAYSFGVADFINRPLDADTVRQRVSNTITLYAKQRKMESIIAQKMSESEKTSQLMTDILCNIVEARNGESGAHVHNIKTMTGMFLRKLIKKTDKYAINENDIPIYCNAAALHDIGKVCIPRKVLNKPGKLTVEEFEIVKKHSVIGAEMIFALKDYHDEPLVNLAYEICHSHHERWDGTGYPDGLAGDDIPISAQIVSIVDSYDALTSERCYKNAISHSHAIQMILNGECGEFNPLLLECMRELDDELAALPKEKYSEAEDDSEIDMKKYDHLLDDKSILNYVDTAKEKIDFLINEIQDPVFSYNGMSDNLKVYAKGREWWGEKFEIHSPVENKNFISVMPREIFEEIVAASHKTTPEEPDFNMVKELNIKGEQQQCLLRCRTLWVGVSNKYSGFIGRIVKLS